MRRAVSSFRRVAAHERLASDQTIELDAPLTHVRVVRPALRERQPAEHGLIPVVCRIWAWRHFYITPFAIPHAGSHRRRESAKLVAEIVQQLISRAGPAHILILAPFVAQKKLIRDTLNACGLRRVRVSTVHAAQGAEMDTIIFDPLIL